MSAKNYHISCKFCSADVSTSRANQITCGSRECIAAYQSEYRKSNRPERVWYLRRCVICGEAFWASSCKNHLCGDGECHRQERENINRKYNASRGGRERLREYRKGEVYKAYRLARSKTQRFKDAQRKRQKKYNATPEAKAASRARASTPEAKAKAKARQSAPEARAKERARRAKPHRIEHARAYRQTEVYRAKARIRSTKRHAAERRRKMNLTLLVLSEQLHQNKEVGNAKRD